jgi:hypothetical protein
MVPKGRKINVGIHIISLVLPEIGTNSFIAL